MLEIGKQIIHLPTVDSTNNYAANMLSADKMVHGTVILADDQQNGRGQRMTQWQSLPGLNLTCSVVLTDVDMQIEQQFLISAWVAVSVSSFFEKIGLKSAIKWPNDIYINDRKVCGVLIENSLRGSQIKHAIVGIGLNVNQVDFGHLPATSIRTELGQMYPVRDVLAGILSELNTSSHLLRKSDQLFRVYESKLYLKGVETTFFDTNDQPFSGIIEGVGISGKLCMKIGDETRYFDLKEVRFKQSAF